MFEGIVSQCLSTVLGNFIEGLNPDQLKLGITSGEVVLVGLEIKRNALDFLNLPIKITRGCLGSLRVSIPWSSLLSAPIEISFSDIVAVAEPQTSFVVCSLFLFVIHFERADLF